MFSSVGEGFRGGLMITDHHHENSTPLKIGSCTIKAAYNSAMTPGGKMVVGGPNEQKGLYEVIGKGCRFLDFAVFNDNDKVAIGYHTGGDFLNEESLISCNTIAPSQIWPFAKKSRQTLSKAEFLIHQRKPKMVLRKKYGTTS